MRERTTPAWRLQLGMSAGAVGMWFLSAELFYGNPHPPEGWPGWPAAAWGMASLTFLTFWTVRCYSEIAVNAYKYRVREACRERGGSPVSR